ncbi:hypothetical protein EI555_009520, partial [Monodon monoceros]
PVRAGPGYSQQEAHVGRAVGCVLGGREASGWRRRRRPGKEKKEEEERMRRRGAPAARRPQLFQWLAEGAEVGSARLESLSGRRSKKGRRKGHSPPPQRTTTATAALLPHHFVSSPSLPLPRELSRERRAPTLPLPLRPRVPYFLDTFAAPGHAPQVCWGHPFGRGQSTRLGVVAERSELLSWVSAVRKEIGCNSGMSESCSEGFYNHKENDSSHLFIG